MNFIRKIRREGKIKDGCHPIILPQDTDVAAKEAIEKKADEMPFCTANKDSTSVSSTSVSRGLVVANIGVGFNINSTLQVRRE
jgi:hypothetical protein